MCYDSEHESELTDAGDRHSLHHKLGSRKVNEEILSQRLWAKVDTQERHDWECIEPYFCIGVTSHVKNRKNTMRKHIQSAATHVRISSSPPPLSSRPRFLHAHAIRVEAVAESYLNVGGICCLVL